MITNADIYDHKQKYPTFNVDRFDKWLRDNPKYRFWYDSIPKALKRMHKNNSFDKWCENMK